MAMTLSLLLSLGGAQAAPATTDQWGECLDVGTWFEAITNESHAVGFGNSLGVTINDFDFDGDNDMYVATSTSRIEGAGYYSGESLLYLNQFGETGEIVFEEVGNAWGVDDLCEDRQPMFGDLDNDGLPDMYVTVNGNNVLYRNLSLIHI